MVPAEFAAAAVAPVAIQGHCHSPTSIQRRRVPYCALLGLALLLLLLGHTLALVVVGASQGLVEMAVCAHNVQLTIAGPSVVAVFVTSNFLRSGATAGVALEVRSWLSV